MQVGRAKMLLAETMWLAMEPGEVAEVARTFERGRGNLGNKAEVALQVEAEVEGGTCTGRVGG